MTLVLDSPAASDALDDSAVVVQDVLAFLDAFDRPSSNDSAVDNQQSAANASDSLGTNQSDQRTASIDATQLARRRTRAEASNRARVQRYQRQKAELHELRRQVSSLEVRVALLHQCARSPVQVRQTSALGVTIRRVLGSTATASGLNWQRRAHAEREMRVRSEQTNAKLRQLLRASLERGSDLRGEVQKAGDAIRTTLIGEGQPQPPTKLDDDMLDSVWTSVLRQLYEEACALADRSSTDSFEDRDWIVAVSDKQPATWTSLFSISHSDPRAVGKQLWRSIQAYCLSPSSGTDLFKVRHGQVPRLEKRATYPVFDAQQQEIRVSGATLFEAHDKDGDWMLVALSSVYDSTGTDLLFRATSTKVVTKPRSAHSQSCTMRTHYRVSFAASDRVTTLGGGGSSPAQLAVNAWAKKMRIQDEALTQASITGG